MSSDPIHIIIISPSSALEELLGQWKNSVGIQCKSSANTEYALDFITTKQPDIIITDMPDSTGIQTLLDACPNTIPVIQISNKKDASSPAHGAILHKPLRVSQLFSILETYLPQKMLPLSLGCGLYLFVSKRLLADNPTPVSEGGTLKLTEKETDILHFLYKNSDKPVERDRLLSIVWGYNPAIDTHTIETHMYRLRQKIAGHFSGVDVIVTVPGGYILKGSSNNLI